MAEYANDGKRKFVRRNIIDSAVCLSCAALFWILFRTLGSLSGEEIISILFIAEYIKTQSGSKQTKMIRIVYFILSGGFYIYSAVNFLDGIVPMGIFFLVFGSVFLFCSIAKLNPFR